MSEFEIDLARDYLAATKQDAIAALIWAVKDLARARRVAAAAHPDSRHSTIDGWAIQVHPAACDRAFAIATAG